MMVNKLLLFLFIICCTPVSTKSSAAAEVPSSSDGWAWVNLVSTSEGWQILRGNGNIENVAGKIKISLYQDNMLFGIFSGSIGKMKNDPGNKSFSTAKIKITSRGDGVEFFNDIYLGEYNKFSFSFNNKKTNRDIIFVNDGANVIVISKEYEIK